MVCRDWIIGMFSLLQLSFQAQWLIMPKLHLNRLRWAQEKLQGLQVFDS